MPADLSSRPLLNRRTVLSGGVALGALALSGRFARAQERPLLTVESTTLDVNGKAAKVFTVKGPAGEGMLARQGDRLSGALINATDAPLQMHWHGQILAPPGQDRARPDGGSLAPGATDPIDFELTPGTHWMHSHTLTEQQLLAAPLVTREADAGDVRDVVVMLHDFAFRSPQELLAELGGTDGHAGGHSGMHAASAAPAMGGHDMGGQNMGGGHSGHGMTMGGMNMGGMGMAHANDIAYDAFLANRRTLADPEVVQVERGAPVRLRIINGGTATAFFLSVPGLAPRCVAVDGTPCAPVRVPAFPLAQGQRIDLVVDIPREGGAFPVLAQVEGATARTGIILATPGAAIARIGEAAEAPEGLLDLSFESGLAATRPLAPRPPDRVFPVLLGEEPGYRWTINGRIHGEDEPFEVRQGERVEMTFMNPTMMSHPMHIHGHHFQVVGLGGPRFSGAMRDTVIVPPHRPVTIAFDAGQKGEWFLHCHHLYHMAGGMMAVVRVV